MEMHMIMQILDSSNPTICHRLSYSQKQSSVCLMQQTLAEATLSRKAFYYPAMP